MPPLTLDVAVVHVEPTTQIVLKESAAARFVPTLTDGGFQVRWPERKVVPPFLGTPLRRPSSSLRSGLGGDAASIDFRG